MQGKVNVTVYGNDHVVVVRWDSNPVYDMYADSVVAAILHAQANPVPDKCERGVIKCQKSKYIYIYIFPDLPSNSSFPQFNTAIEGMVKHVSVDLKKNNFGVIFKKK